MAAFDRSDEHHKACAELLAAVREPRVIPAPVLVELDNFPDSRVRIAAYADLRVGFVDAAVLAIVERLQEPKLATHDYRHVAAMRPRHVGALTLLPADLAAQPPSHRTLPPSAS